MSSRHPPILGICPTCDTEIATINVLIEYEAEDGRPKVWAECPGCEEIVHPV